MEQVIPDLLGLEALQPIQVFLAGVELVLEGVVAAVTEVRHPHGHLCQVLPPPGSQQGPELLLLL